LLFKKRVGGMGIKYGRGSGGGANFAFTESVLSREYFSSSIYFVL